jgi:hypothetical protein
VDIQSALNVILVIGVILGGVGYALGTFVSQKRKGTAEALGVALDEIAALRVKAERQDQELLVMRGELAALRAENETLRSLLTGGTFLAEQIRTLLAEEIEKGVRMTAALIRQGGGNV